MKIQLSFLYSRESLDHRFFQTPRSRKEMGQSSRLHLLSQARLAGYQCLKNRAKMFIYILWHCGNEKLLIMRAFYLKFTWLILFPVLALPEQPECRVEGGEPHTWASSDWRQWHVRSALQHNKAVLIRRLQGDDVYHSWPIIAPLVYEPKCGGEGGGCGLAGSQPMRSAVHITWHGAQISLGDLTPYLNFGCNVLQHFGGKYVMPFKLTSNGA